AVGTELSAELYGLAVAAQDIQDASDNATRFFVVKKSAAPLSAGAGPSGAGADLSGAAQDQRFAVATSPTGRDKTTIVFGFAVDAPGNLYHALGEFANRGINLSKLESRPTKRALGHYLFFADLDGHALDARVAEALDALARRCAYMKVLGSYPKADYAGVTLPRAFPPTGPRDSRRSRGCSRRSRLCCRRPCRIRRSRLCCRRPCRIRCTRRCRKHRPHAPQRPRPPHPPRRRLPAVSGG